MTVLSTPQEPAPTSAGNAQDRQSPTGLSLLRGAARVVFDAAEGLAGIVEQMHSTIQLRPGVTGDPVTHPTRGITGLVYQSVKGGIRLTGQGVDAGLRVFSALRPEQVSSVGTESFRSVLNGMFGDYLARTQNPLAIEMTLRRAGQAIDPVNGVLAPVPPGPAASGGRLLILVHGLCMNDLMWHREGHDHGAALADELGFVPLYLHYNSGLNVANNGRVLAELLEALVINHPTPVQELAIVGHSMGGLVARSACHYGRNAGHTWPQHHRKLLFLGTPHHGAPLERGGHAADFLMGISPYSAPLTRIGRMRSAGITDLRHGTVSHEKRSPVPLPTDLECYAIAAVRAEQTNALNERLTGDGLVPLHSALGKHRDARRTLEIPKRRQYVVLRCGHLDLLHNPLVYSRMREWLDEAT